MDKIVQALKEGNFFLHPPAGLKFHEAFDEHHNHTNRRPPFTPSESPKSDSAPLPAVSEAISAHNASQSEAPRRRHLTASPVAKSSKDPLRYAIGASANQPLRPITRTFVNSRATFQGRGGNLIIGAPETWFFSTGIFPGNSRTVCLSTLLKNPLPGERGYLLRKT